MKKQALYGICILMAALCACSQAPAPAESTDISVSSAVTESTSNDLRMLSSQSAAGCYQMEETEQGRLFSYIDYAQAVQVPLCASPSCAHNGENCTAWTAPETSVTCPVFLTESSIAFIHTAENGAQTIQSMPLGGGERHVLFSAKDNDWIQTLVCADNHMLYFIVNQVTPGSSELWLYQVSLDGANAKALRQLPAPMLEFKGIEGRNLIFYVYEWAEVPEGEPTWGSHRVLLWNLDTGEEQELDAWKSQEGSSGRTTLWNDGKLYWCSYDEPDAIHWKAPNESTGEIAVSWPDEILNAEETTFVLDDIVQGHALFTVWGPWGTDLLKRYAVDLNQPNSTPIEIPLRYVSNASERPVTILGKGEGQLLVQFQEQASFVAQLDADGSPSKDLQITHQYGLITWENFLAGKPNYREISAQSAA